MGKSIGTPWLLIVLCSFPGFMFPSSKSGIYVCREQEKKRDKKDTLLSSGISDEYQDLSPKPNIQKGINIVDVGGLLITTGID